MREGLSSQCRWVGRSASVLLVGCLSLFATAAAPTLSHVFPAGAQRGATVTVTCSGKFDWPVEVLATGIEARLDDERGRLQVTVPKQLVADRAWLRLYNDEGASQLIPFLVGNLPETQEVEPNDAPSDAQRLADFAPPPGDTDVTINGVLEKNGDVDGFAVRLLGGDTLVAALAAHTAFASPMDAILQVVAPTGTVLGENHDAVGLDPRLIFTAPETGTYVIRVFAFPAKPDQRIEFRGGADYVYRLTLTTGPYVTHTVPMAVCRKEKPSVEVRGWNVPDGASLPVVPLPGNGLTELTPNRLAQNRASAIGMVNVPGWAGGARVPLASHAAIEHMAQTDSERPLPLSVPTSIAGCIRAPGGCDYFKLPLAAERQVSIHVESVGLHSKLVPRVRLRKPDGGVAAEVSESRAAKDAFLTYAAAEGGDHLLTIQDRYRHGGDRYFYRLTVKPWLTDFELTLDTDAIVLTREKPVEIPVTVSRQMVNKKLDEITIEAVDLPDGVTAKPVVSESQGDTAGKVSLKLETTRDTPFSGWIRIRGSAASLPKRFARTPTKFGACFDRIWLTVGS